jgi:corrinoid protein of di/trimethylamine methyltransferase
MTTESIITKMQASIEQYDADAAIAAAKEAIAAGLDPARALEEGFAEPIRKIGEAFERMDVFLPELVMAANAMKAGVEVLEKAMKEAGKAFHKKGVIVLGTVEGDIHDIGKTVVGAMLQSNGYEVIDLGVEVPAPRFIQAAQEAKANVIAMSALLSTTMLYQRDVMELMKNKGMAGKYFVMVGGAPVTQKWAEEIGANAYARDAVEAVRVLDQHAKEWAQ